MSNAARPTAVSGCVTLKICANTVGELITDVFLLDHPELLAASRPLIDNARVFGEGLQLVNILRDAADDAREGRVYLPPDVPLPEVLALARGDLQRARLYVHTLQQAGAPRGYVAFCALPVLLAFATLDRVEAVGAGAKISRDEVAAIVARLHQALDRNAPAIENPR